MLPYLLANIGAFMQIFLGAYVWRLAYLQTKAQVSDPNLPAETAKVRPARQRNGMLIGGPIIVVSGLLMLLVRPNMFGPAPRWERYFSNDGKVSVRLPFDPIRTARDPGHGLPRVDMYGCQPGRLPVGYALTWTPIEAEIPPEDAPELLEFLKGIFEQQGNDVVSATMTKVDGKPAYDFETYLPRENAWARMRAVYVGRMAYSALATAKDFAGQEADLKRFFDSFRIERQPAD